MKRKYVLYPYQISEYLTCKKNPNKHKWTLNTWNLYYILKNISNKDDRKGDGYDT